MRPLTGHNGLEYLWTGTARPLALSPLCPHGPGHGPSAPTFPRPGLSSGPALPTARPFTRPGPSHGPARPDLLSLPAWPTRARSPHGLQAKVRTSRPAARTFPLAQPPGPSLDPSASRTRPRRPHHASRVLRCRSAPAFWPVSPLTRANKAKAGHHRRQTGTTSAGGGPCLHGLSDPISGRGWHGDYIKISVSVSAQCTRGMTLMGWPALEDGYCHVERRRSWTWIKLMLQRAEARPPSPGARLGTQPDTRILTGTRTWSGTRRPPREPCPGRRTNPG